MSAAERLNQPKRPEKPSVSGRPAEKANVPPKPRPAAVGLPKPSNSGAPKPRPTAPGPLQFPAAIPNMQQNVVQGFDFLTSVLSSVGVPFASTSTQGDPTKTQNGAGEAGNLVFPSAATGNPFAGIDPYMLNFMLANSLHAANMQNPFQNVNMGPMHSAPISQPQPLHEPPVEVPMAEDEDDGGMVHGETYDQYIPSKLALGIAHPDPIVETHFLASASPPDITYKLRLPERIGDEGMLSSLQLEAIVYACQRHETMIGGNKYRAGYLIGDGAGVGKGRTIAGIIYENWLLGRKKAIWLSVSNDLKYDSERDLEDIGASNIDVYCLGKLKYAKINGRENDNIRKGVIFATYASLIGESQGGRGEYGTRMKQLLKWCGKKFDGVLVFDECHRAKNLCPTAGSKATKTGQAVLEIQQALPLARVVYASATGASEPRNMAYMTRLGLWGPETPFKEFHDFTNSVERKGVSAMELIAMDMKLRGMYIARQLSFAGVTFDITEIPIDDEYKVLYDDCVELWTFAREQFTKAAILFQADRKLLKQMWGQFWGAHQRFFKYLCLSSKVKATAKLAKDAVKEGKCAVIGLQSTGEARTLEQLEENRGVLTDFVSTAKAVFQSLVDKHFPAFDRRKAFEIIGLTEEIEDEVEALLDDDPTSNGPKRRPQRKRRNIVASYKQPTMSDLDSFSSTEEEEIELLTKASSSSRPKRGKALGTSDEDEGPIKTKKSGGRNGRKMVAESGDDEDQPKKSKNLGRKRKGQASDSDDESDASEKPAKRKSGGKGKAKPKAPAKKQKKTANKYHVDNESSDDSPGFEPSGSSSSGSDSESITSGDASKSDAAPRGSDSSDGSEIFSDEENPWVKMLEAKRLARKKNKKEQEKKAAINGEQKPVAPPVLDQKSMREVHEEAQILKQALLDKFDELSGRLPNNTLDDLIHRLGGPEHVAEMTGRKGRIVASEAGTVSYEARNECDVALEVLNLTEKQRFMDGEKLIAIISEAASSGISIQADRRAKNQRRRVHITLELPWSADKAIQQFGRTHRSNQISAPQYMFLITDLAGEKRFASAVARRLESLGALTHGDRRATDSRDLSVFNIDTKYGRAAVEQVLKVCAGHMRPQHSTPEKYPGDFLKDAHQAMVDVGILVRASALSSHYVLEKDSLNMGKFLNRILGMRVDLQNGMFEYFTRIMDSLVDTAKREGRFEMGILELGFGSSDVVLEKKLTFTGSTSWNKVATVVYTLSVERGLSWEDAKDILNEFDDKDSGFYLSKTTMAGKHTACLAVLKSGQRSSGLAPNKRLFSVYRPSTGLQLRLDTFEEIKRKGTLVTLDAALSVWQDMYESMARRCVHQYWAGNCKLSRAGHVCDFGLRRRTYTVLSGSVMSAWNEISEVLYRTGVNRKVQNVRVRFKDNTRIVGIIVPNNQVNELVTLLNKDRIVKDVALVSPTERLSDDSSDELSVEE